MPANENIRSPLPEYPFHPRIVIRRGSADMGHPDSKALAVKPKVFGEFSPHGLVIYVSVNGANGLELLKRANHRGITDIAGVPDLIDMPEMFSDTRVKVTVGV